MCPPAIVSGGEYARRMYRSPRARTAGRSSRSRTNARAPGASVGTPPPSDGPTIATRPRISAVPWWNAHARAVAQRPRVGQHLDDGVGQARLFERAGRHQTLPALDLVHLDAAQIHGRALAGGGLAAGARRAPARRAP